MNQSKHLLTETEVSKAYGFTLSWLRSMRVRGGGIPFHKISRCVRYREEDIESYLSDNRVTSTTEAQNV